MADARTRRFGLIDVSMTDGWINEQTSKRTDRRTKHDKTISVNSVYNIDNLPKGKKKDDVKEKKGESSGEKTTSVV